MILLWGLREDPPTAALERALAALRAPVAFLSQVDVFDTEVALAVDGRVEGHLRYGAFSFDLDCFRSVYVRPLDTTRLRHVAATGVGSRRWVHAASVEDGLLTWLELSSAYVLNRPAAMASNNSKPYQSVLIRRAGFATPDTLVTTDPDEAREFWERHREVVYKSISGIRSIVARLQPSDGDRFERLVWCPTQFQQYIGGRDYRVHVVGSELFACEVVSDADDYRYASRRGGDVAVADVDLPDECAERCLRLSRELDLPLAGIDLRLAPDGSWYCFEVNPSPGFTYYEDETGQPIARAVARLLLDPPQGSD